MIFTIFKKELKETLRDKKTIMSMIVIPMLLFPILFTVMFKIQDTIESSLNNKTLNIGVIGDMYSEQYIETLEQLPEELGAREILRFADTITLKQQIEEGNVHFGIYLPPFLEDSDDQFKTSEINIYYKMSELGIGEKAKMYAETLFAMSQSKRLNQANINPELITPYHYTYINVSTNQETLANLVGGFLPYIFIVFGFVGCMYPCIDLFTGEKERGTFETLLTTPVTRWQIMLGKMGVVVMSGFLAACFTIVGMLVSLNVFSVVENQEIITAVRDMFTLKSVLLLLALLFPLVVLFAGAMIPIAVNAKSFKEAQSIITPLNMVFIMIAVIGMIPGITFNSLTASIPVVNVVLGIKSLLAGRLDIGLLALSFIIMIVIAGISISISYRKFDDERNILL